MNVYCTDGTEEGFYTAAFSAYADRDCVVTSAKRLQLPLGAELIETQTDPEKGGRVRKKVRACDARAENDISLVLRRGCDGREMTALGYLRLLVKTGAPVRDMLAHPAVIEMWDERGKVTYEAHRFTGFLRFSEGANGVFYAPFEPDNDVLELILPHFIKRFAAQAFVIHDTARRKAGLYLSFDGENYSLAALVNNQANAAGFMGEGGSYTDCELSDGQWVYFRAVLLVTYPGSFIGVGLGKFDGDTVQVNYLNAYRASYEPEPPFESGYFYTRDYSYDGERSGKGSLLSSSYSPWDDSYSIENLFDADDSDFIHSDRTPISESNAFEVTADLGRAFLADTFTVYGESSRQYQPRDLKLYAGASPDDLQLVADVKDAP